MYSYTGVVSYYDDKHYRMIFDKDDDRKIKNIVKNISGDDADFVPFIGIEIKFKYGSLMKEASSMNYSIIDYISNYKSKKCKVSFIVRQNKFSNSKSISLISKALELNEYNTL